MQIGFVQTMQIIQAQTDVIHQKIQSGDIEYDEYISKLTYSEELTSAEQAEIKNKTYSETSDFRKLDTQEALRQIDVDGIKGAYYINFKTGEVIGQDPNSEYKSLEDYGFYKTKTAIITIQVLGGEYTDYKYSLKATIQYPDNTASKEYKINDGGWVDYSEDGFTVNNNDIIYTRFKSKSIGNDYIESTTKTVLYERFTENGVYNEPKLATGMKPVAWNGTTWDEVEPEFGTWHDYQDEEYAHVKLKDGSIFMWVPRFAYTKDGELVYSNIISDNVSDDDKGNLNGVNIDNVFISKDNKYLTGFWVAKYEASEIENMNIIQSINENADSTSISDLAKKCTYIASHTRTYGLSSTEVESQVIEKAEFVVANAIFSSDLKGSTNVEKENRPIIKVNEVEYENGTITEYVVTLNYQGATSGVTDKSLTVQKDGNYPSLPTPSKEGYTVSYDTNGGNEISSSNCSLEFLGWYTSNGEEATAGESIIYNNKHTLYAKWNTESKVILPTATKSGRTFTGWNTKSDGTGTSYEAGAEFTTSKDVTLYAQWEITPYTYTIAYNGNGANRWRNFR